MRRRLAALFLSFELSSLGFAPARAVAENKPRLAEDFTTIMEWLASESAEGMAFHSATTFDPPVELRPGGVGFDVNFGIGTIPVHKQNFPQKLQVKTLQDQHPEQNFNNATLFPDLTTHLRYGFADRWEGALRFSDMTVPRRKISPTTEAQGQSNIVGAEVRKHMGDPRLERVTAYATYDYIWGSFKFFNGYKSVAVTDTLSLSSKNQGFLAWGVKTYGLGFTVSHEFGRWVPYYGFGYHYSQGMIHTRLRSDFATPIVSPVVGDGHHPVAGSQQLRMTLGSLLHGRHVSWYGVTEVLAFGSKAGRAFAVHFGVSVPVKAGNTFTPIDSRAPQDLKDAPNEEPEAEPAPSLILIR